MAVISAGAFHRRSKTSEAFEQLTIDATVGGKALTSATYGTARYAEISVETAPIRFTVDGTPPTITLGHLVSPNDVIRIDSAEDIAAFRAIRATATSGVINVSYQEMKLT